MEQFKQIADISHYNYNYYVGFDKDLLFGKSDDDNTTEWWLISSGAFLYLGESYCSENELLHRYEELGNEKREIYKDGLTKSEWNDINC
jgi:hypothetical protein